MAAPDLPRKRTASSEPHSPLLSQTSRGSKTTDVSSTGSALRKQLSSFAWVQCDNIKCLKWRKISSTVAEKLADKTWTCEMNENPDFQSCSAPEEDTALFDRLAKKVNLDLIKSEIKKGSLVWAKMDGYCRWPALITNDPACDIHADGDEEEILWYHVEFLGCERSHGWVRTERVQVFGTNCEVVETKDTKKNTRRGRKKGKVKHSVKTPKTGKLKKTYKGGTTIQKAISEALSLLPLPLEERINTCWFISEDGNIKGSASSSGNRKEKRDSRLKDLSNISKKRKCAEKKAKKSSCILPKNENQETRKVKRKRTEKININAEDVKDKETRQCDQKRIMNKAYVLDNSGGEGENKRAANRVPIGLKCLHFPSSLIGTSKEERFMLDVQMYRTNEKAFEEDVERFMSSHGLTLSSPPIWHNVKVNIFSIFLAVYERGGYERVCENHQWGIVYNEVTHQQTYKGSSIVKRFYSRNIYAYELFVTGQDYNLALRALQQAPIGKQIQKKGDEYQEFKASNSEDSDSDVGEYLESLDELLQILGKEEKDNAQKVPEWNQTVQCDPLEDFVDTASISGRAVEPEESAQVVPELDFPSSPESSDDSSNLRGFHEMQALQMDVGELDDQINFL
ncbi:hypothetical protein RRG08_026858 [Elysia crispata]|uniref:Uncharacterized protein n=1 Tax=Elysia crispata TaxID=231223 RepID=A0AAE1CT38_9GAST|nr:hypothetical protein RRG08_026858 [Elysia crispata]